jgi:catechol 2,3-dioxygenase-like lactoylglutathione lyase family enzyme
MSFRGISHVALLVNDLREAEGYYRHLFGMMVAYRETFLEGEWRTYRSERSWEDLATSWPGPRLSVLRRDGFVLMLEQGEPGGARDQLDHVGIHVEPADLDEMRWRAVDARCQTVTKLATSFVFVDRFQVQWEVSADSAPDDPLSQSSGIRAGRWLD